MANIYEIRREIENFEYEVDEETGELLNALTWDELNMAFEEKVENIACCIKNLIGDIAKFKAEEERIAKRRKGMEKKAEYLRKLLIDNMSGEKYSSAKCSVSFRTSESVLVDDANKLPEELRRMKISVEPDKVAIKAALIAGQEITGCKLVKNTSVQIK